MKYVLIFLAFILTIYYIPSIIRKIIESFVSTDVYNYWANKHLPWRMNNSGQYLYERFTASIDLESGELDTQFIPWEWLPIEIRDCCNDEDNYDKIMDIILYNEKFNRDFRESMRDI